MVYLKKVANIQTKKLKTGGVGYVWTVPTKDRKKGCPLVSEALPRDPQEAALRGTFLNTQLNEWRKGNATAKKVVVKGRESVEDIINHYYRTEEFLGTAKSTQAYYREVLGHCISLRSDPNKPAVFGNVTARSINKSVAKKFYQRALISRDGTGLRIRVADGMVTALRRVWNVCIEEELVEINPWNNLKRRKKQKNKTRPFMRHEFEFFVAEADRRGEYGIAAAAVMAFEFCQRNINVRQFTWQKNWRPGYVFYVEQSQTNVELNIPPLAIPGLWDGATSRGVSRSDHTSVETAPDQREHSQHQS